MLELLVVFAWTACVVGASWMVWRLAYAQGQADAQLGQCCTGHEEHEIPMPTPDQWDTILDRILTETDRRPTAGGR